MRSTPLAQDHVSVSKYPVINESDLEWGLAVAASGHRRMSRAEVYPPRDQPTEYFFDSDQGRRLGEYQLLYITRGHGTFRSQHTAPTTVHEGDMILLHPGEWHTYRPDARTGWDEYWVGFKGLVIDELVKRGFFRVDRPIYHVGVNEQFVSLYNRILEVAQQERIGFQQMLGGLVFRLLGEMQYVLRNQQFSDSEVARRIDRAKVVMQENIFTSITPEEIAVRLNLSYSWFRKAFKDYTGFAPGKYILALKLKKAKTMLVSTQKSVKEISMELQFENPEYFSTVFRRTTGQTPLAYRRNNQ